MQTDFFLQNLHPSDGFENMTALDVISRYLSAYPVTDASAKTIADLNVHIMIKHTYLPSTLITDKVRDFTSKFIAENAQSFGVQTKMPQRSTHKLLAKYSR